jgi:ABC-2 type transport system permease protein
MNQKASGLSSEGAPTRPFYWSVRRELWENRAIYIAPLIVTGVVLFGYLLSMVHFAERRRNALLLDEVHRHAAIGMPFGVAGMMIMFTAIIVGIFYCLDALYGERRDRSVLFWKSLPVSDVTTVLSKISIPLVVLPLVSFFIIVPMQLIMLLISSGVLLANDLSPAVTFANFPIPLEWVVLFYGLVAVTLWHAPIYSYLMLVSVCARRATFLWAVLPFVALMIFERVTFGTAHFYLFLKHRISGFAPDAFYFPDPQIPCITSLSQLTPGRYLSVPGLWLGLIFAAICLIAAIRLRRYRGPI